MSDRGPQVRRILQHTGDWGVFEHSPIAKMSMLALHALQKGGATA